MTKLNVGVDFGSTYTVVSVYRAENDSLDAVTPDLDSPYIPSVVTYDTRRKRYEYGKAAKKNTGKPDKRTYKAFKMLLNAQMDAGGLAERGYTGEDTPERITALFLERILKKTLDITGADSIGTLVVGVPEVWCHSLNTVDGRGVLRQICTGFDFVERAEVVSEPAAASAFFAYNYRRQTGEDFDGRVLMIDYGGGTLDITLTRVESEKGGIEITVLDRDGAGENTDRRIGSAGIVYMESLTEDAIAASGLLDGPLAYDAQFYKAVDELEAALLSSTEEIEDTFGELMLTPELLDEEEFTVIRYGREDIVITYGQMLATYDRVIRDVLAEKLLHITRENRIDTAQDNFKIALVGGFCSFYLVRRQVEDFFSISSNDRRLQGIIRNREDCEKAISLGAALLASGVVSIRHTADFSLGIYAYRDETHRRVAKYYAIRYKQEIENDRIYYPTDAAGNPYVYYSPGGSLERFLINFGPHDKTADGLVPKRELAEKLRGIVANQYHAAVVGFSIDAADVISIHVHDYDRFSGSMSETPTVVRLTTFKDMFDVFVLGGDDDAADKGA